MKQTLLLICTSVTIAMTTACAHHKKPSERCAENDYWKRFDDYKSCVQTLSMEQMAEEQRLARILND